MKQTLTKIGLVTGAFMIAGTAFAAIDGNERFNGHRGGDHKPSEEMITAIESQDYDAFVSLLDERRSEHMTEERFENMVEFHEARESGDEDKLAELRAERKAEHQERKAERKERHEENKAARDDALESGDYDAFAALVPEGRDAPSEEVFELIIDLHEARDADDQDALDEAKQALKDAGFERPQHKRGGDRGEKRMHR